MFTVAKKTLVAALGFGLSVMAWANDPIVGKWKMSENGQEKAIVTISKSGDGYNAVMTKGLTDKAKKREGAIVISAITAQGNGKYTGKGKHPTLPIKGKVDITLNGNSITLKSRAGTQTGVRQ